MPGRKSSGAIDLPQLATPANPAASRQLLYPKSDGIWYTKNSSGAEVPVGSSRMTNKSLAAQGAGFAADTYLTGSNVAIPAGALAAGARYFCKFTVTKTAAGLATPILTLRFGTAASTADTARLTFTFPAQTAVVDNGVFEVEAIFRAAGAAAILIGQASLVHSLSTTGLCNVPGSTIIPAASASFDATPASSQIGLSVNGGASAAWTVQYAYSALVLA